MLHLPDFSFSILTDGLESNMYLEDLSTRFELTVLRNGEFQSLGKADNIGTRMLTFLESDQYLPAIVRNKNVACVLAPAQLARMLPDQIGVVITDNPRDRFYDIHEYLRLSTNFYWRDFDTEIASTARVHPAAFVAPRNVRIGADSIVEAHAVILERAVVGRGAILRSCCVIGGDSFEFRRKGGMIRNIADAGGVALGDRVEVQHGSVIQNSVYGGFTTIDDDTKVGALVMIAHNGRVGKRCLISEGATICGNCIIGDDVVIGPGSTISSRVKVHDGAHVSLGSVVVRNVKKNQTVSGNFAVGHERFLRFMGNVISNPEF